MLRGTLDLWLEKQYSFDRRWCRMAFAQGLHIMRATILRSASYNPAVPPVKTGLRVSEPIAFRTVGRQVRLPRQFLTEFPSDVDCFDSMHASSTESSPSNTRRLQGGHRYLLVAQLFVLVCCGCGPDAEIREYVVPPESERVFTSDLLKDEFGSIPFDWKVPEAWSIAENDQFSKIAWEVGPEAQEARITVSDLPIAAGLVPQITRWRGQVKLTQGPQDDPMQGTDPLKIGDVSATYVDIQGPEETILGLLVPVKTKLWIFKFRGNNKVAEDQRQAFRSFSESIQIP